MREELRSHISLFMDASMEEIVEIEARMRRERKGDGLCRRRKTKKKKKS